MSFIYLSAGFVTGAIVGSLGALLFLRWRLKRQIGSFQQNMEDLMDMTGEMDEAFEDMEDSLEIDRKPEDEGKE